MKQPELKYVKTTMVRERPGDNPNVMEPSQYAMLVNAVAKLGFIQTVAVRTKMDGRTKYYELVDGHHRWKAAQEAGIDKIPVLIADHLDDTQAAAAMLSLNRLKGEVDLGKAAIVLKDLSDLGFSDMTLTGFNGADIATLMKGVGIPNALDDLGQGAGAGPAGVETEKDTTSKRYSVRLTFDRPEDRDELKAAALASGSTVEAGLLAIVRGQKGASP